MALLYALYGLLPDTGPGWLRVHYKVTRTEARRGSSGHFLEEGAGKGYRASIAHHLQHHGD